MNITAIIEIGKDMTYDIYTSDDSLDFMVLGQGKTITEAKEVFYNCLEAIEALYTEEEKSFNFDELTFLFKYDVASFLRYSPFTLTWLSYVTGIKKNNWVTIPRVPGILANPLWKKSNKLSPCLQKIISKSLFWNLEASSF